MADYTATANGSYGDAATWGGAGVPGVGDTFTIPIAYTVTVSDLRTAGRSLNDGSIDFTIEGILRIVGGGTFRARGNCRTVGSSSEKSHLDIEAGGVFEFDASAAAVPATTSYTWEYGVNADARTRLRAAGTAQNRCRIGHVTGGGKGRFFAGQINTLRPWLSYCDLDLGGQSNEYGIDTSCYASQQVLNTRWNQSTPGGGLRLNNHLQSWAKFEFDSNNFRNTNSGFSLHFQRNAVPDGGVANYIRLSAFDQTCQIDSPVGMEIEDCVFGRGAIFTHSGGAPLKVDNNAFGMYQATGMGPPRGGFTNCIFYTLLGDSNQHYISFSAPPAGDYAVTGCIFDGVYSTSNGDVCVLNVGIADAGGTVTFSFNLMLPHADGINSVGVFTAHGNALTNMILENNTSANKLTNIGEEYAGHSDQLKSCKGNLVHGQNSSQRYVIEALQQTVDHALSANVSHNHKHNLDTGSNGVGYHNMIFSSGSPGANDTTGDPLFVDSNRRMDTWAASLGLAPTYQAAHDELMKLGGADENPLASVDTLRAWLYAGWTPQNQALKASDHNGQDRGAIPVGSAPVVGGAIRSLLDPALIR